MLSVFHILQDGSFVQSKYNTNDMHAFVNNDSKAITPKLGKNSYLCISGTSQICEVVVKCAISHVHDRIVLKIACNGWNRAQNMCFMSPTVKNLSYSIYRIVNFWEFDSRLFYYCMFITSIYFYLQWCKGHSKCLKTLDSVWFWWKKLWSCSSVYKILSRLLAQLCFCQGETPLVFCMTQNMHQCGHTMSLYST